MIVDHQHVAGQHRAKYEIHPVAELFPLMTDEELQGLIDDIDQNGQREPVTIWNGKLIDGRNRQTACERLGRAVDAQELDPETDPVKWVISHNLHRRHLTPSQRALVGTKIKELLEPAAKERQRAAGGDKKSDLAKSVPVNLPGAVGGDSRDKAAKSIIRGLTPTAAAAKVLDKGTPELIKACEAGTISVSKAAKMVDEAERASIEPQLRVVTEPAKPKKTTKGRLWKEAPAAHCPRRPEAGHEWGEDDCTLCHEPAPQNNDERSLVFLSDETQPLEDRAERLLEILHDLDRLDRLGHSFREAASGRFREELQFAMEAIAGSVNAFKGHYLGDSEDEKKLFALCAVLDGTLQRGASV